MAVLTVRVSDELKRRLDEAASDLGITPSEVVREQIEQMLGRRTSEALGLPRGDLEPPTTLRVVDRKMLTMLHLVLHKLGEDPDLDEEDHLKQVAVLENGFVGEYGKEFANIDAELSRQDCELVWDLLDMFRVIGASVRRLNEQETRQLGESTIDSLTFNGLDANDSYELDLLIYMRYLIKQGKWEELAPAFATDRERGNSHSRNLPTYLSMLTTYTPIFKEKLRNSEGLQFSVAELRQIARAK